MVKSDVIMSDNDTIRFTPKDGASGTSEYVFKSKTDQIVYIYSTNFYQRENEKQYLILKNSFTGKLTHFYRTLDLSRSKNYTRVHFYNPNGATVSVKNDENTWSYFRGETQQGTVYVKDREDKETLAEFSFPDVKSGEMYCEYSDEKDKYRSGRKYYKADFTITGNDGNISLPEKVFEVQYGKIYRNSDSIEDMTSLYGILLSGEVAAITVACIVFVLIILGVVYWFYFRSKFDIVSYVNLKNIVLLLIVVSAFINFVGSVAVSAQLRKYIEPYFSYVSGSPKVLINTERANIAIPVIFIVVGTVSWIIAMRSSGVLQYILIGVIISLAAMEMITNGVFNSVATFYNYQSAGNTLYSLIEYEIKAREVEDYKKFCEDIENIDPIKNADFWGTITDKTSTFLVLAFVVLILSLVYWFILGKYESQEEKREIHEQLKNPTFAGLIP